MYSNIDLQSDWDYSEIEELKNVRKHYTKFDKKDISKEIRKIALRRIKISTIIIDFLMGKRSDYDIAAELQEDADVLLAYRFNYKDLITQCRLNKKLLIDEADDNERLCEPL